MIDFEALKKRIEISNPNDIVYIDLIYVGVSRPSIDLVEIERALRIIGDDNPDPPHPVNLSGAVLNLLQADGQWATFEFVEEAGHIWIECTDRVIEECEDFSRQLPGILNDAVQKLRYSMEHDLPNRNSYPPEGDNDR
jgi:hypothetical protein